MKIAIDVEAWKSVDRIEAVSQFPREPDPAVAYKFIIEGRSEVIVANVAKGGGFIELFPERSASHRALKAVLEP